MKQLRIVIFLWALVLVPAASLQAAPEKQVIDGVTYHVIRCAPGAVRIVWTDGEGRPLGTFPQAVRFLRQRGESIATVMNGGIFEPGGVPSGLLIQDGKVLRSLNLADGEGNFFLKPNGVFFVGGDVGSVVASGEFPVEPAGIRFAVQSGPLLLRHGKIHPKFNVDSKWRLHRNGVGIDGDGKVVFAMTDFHSPKFPNLHEFARLFLELGCADALFLDGDLSQMRSPPELEKASMYFGSFIAVVNSKEKEEEGSSREEGTDSGE